MGTKLITQCTCTYVLVKRKETVAMDAGAGNFYVEQTQCAMCNRPTTQIGIREIDTMRGKEPVVCGFCLVEISKSATEQIRRDSEDSTSRKFTGG